MNLGDFMALGMEEQRRILDAASRQSRSKALLDSIRGDAEFIIEACDGECYCDPSAIADGEEPCAACQCTAAAKGILSTLSNNH